MPLTASPGRVLARPAAVTAVVCALLGLIAAPRVRAQHGTAFLRVRVYNRFGVASRDLDTARGTATVLLENAGLAVQWRDCQSASAVGDRCSDMLAPSEVSIRLVASPPSFGSGDVLGYSDVDAASRRGTLATVFPDRVMAIASDLRVASATLLGRAMAHEVGHLLLGSDAHSAVGLMRGRWSVGRPSAPTDWQFSPDEAVHMQEGLIARSSDEAAVVATR